MIVKLLPWDSSFFKKRIGSISLTRKDEINHLSGELDKARKNGFQLVYVFTSYSIPQSSKLLKSFRTRKVDEKVIYRMKINSSYGQKQSLIRIVPYSAKNAGRALTALAIQSGVHSRFKFDPGFRSSEFRRLYTLWIQRSVRREISDETFVSLSSSSTRITGFITLKKRENESIIDLIGVDAAYRGKGVGSSLIRKAQEWAVLKNTPILSVATQRDNKAACGLYKKMGFGELSSTFIYHFWL